MARREKSLYQRITQVIIKKIRTISYQRKGVISGVPSRTPGINEDTQCVPY
jgi:hypothetical protein